MIAPALIRKPRKQRALRNAPPADCDLIVEVVLVHPTDEAMSRRHGIACLALLNLGLGIPNDGLIR